MNKLQLLSNMILPKAVYVLAPLLLLLVGCAGPLAVNTQLSSATEAYNEAAQSAKVVEFAPVALKEAEEALEKSHSLWEAKADKSSVDHHAYIALQRTLIAKETAAFNEATKEISRGEVERQQVLLDVRSSEADQSEARARRAQEEARGAQEEARGAQEAARGAQEEARAERALADEARRTAELLAERVSELEARPTDRGLVLTLGDVLFETGKSDMRSAGMKNMDELASFLKEYPERNIMIEGFTDNVGSESFNMDLSNKRANSVKAAMVNRNIAENRIRTVGYGLQYPVANNDSATGRQQNRRVEIIISDKDGNIAPRGQ